MNTRADPIVLLLPEAPPRLYLRWMAYWRDIEGRLLRNRLLERFASSESAPFLSDAVAQFISRKLVAEIERQAAEAILAGDGIVAPKVSGDPELLRNSIDYVIRRGRWLQRPEVAEVTGLPTLEDDLANLRARVMAVLQLQIAGLEAGSP